MQQRTIHRTLMNLVIATAVMLAVPASAHAGPTGSITYTCGFNICKRAAAGGTVTKVTTGGTKAKAFAFGAASRNGAVTVYTRSGEAKAWVYIKRGASTAKQLVSSYWGVPIGYARLNATGTHGAWNEIAYNYDGFGNLGPIPYFVNLPLSAKSIDGSNGVHTGFTSHVGFGRGASFLSINQYGTSICERPIDKSVDAECVVVATVSGTDRTFGPVSELAPNNKLLVTTTQKVLDDQSWISVFDVASGKLVRHLTTKGAERNPTISPDGKYVAYECAKHICTRPIAGGAEQVWMRSASFPTWSKK